MKVSKKFTCIIPFYNEGKQILSVIKAISKIRVITQTIAVDDGSTDNAYLLINKQYPKINLIRLNCNQGKSDAVFAGLKHVKNENILLMDADWLHLNYQEIEKALRKYIESKVDLLILKNTGNNLWIDEKLRKYIFLSGNRIIKQNDLIEVQKLRPTGYQLEAAINRYMITHNRQTAWTETSAFNPHKVVKLGFIKGLVKDLRMEWQIISYLGVTDYLKQMFTFCRQPI